MAFSKIVSFVLVLFSMFGYGQQAVISSGGNAVNSNGTVSYTVGQVCYNSELDTNFSNTQGVQQPFEISVLTVTQNDKDTTLVSVYPNPTSNNLTLYIKNSNLDNLNYQILDVTGKTISKEEKITQNQTQINFENLPSTVYFIEITSNNKSLKTFRIIKN